MAGSHKIAKRRADLISAALRHVRDAEHLAQAGPGESLDQAFHLAGFGPECARKACLSDNLADKAIGHGFDGGAEAVLRVALALDVHAHRYRAEGWEVRYPALTEWKVESRYWATGTANQPDRLSKTSALLRDVRSAVDNVVLAMWTDGLLSTDALA